MYNNFTAIDFETAQGYRNSICQVGLVRFEKGKVVYTFEQLIRPPKNYYWEQFTDLHGIDAEKTKYSPTFDKIWPKIKPYIETQHLVAHNAVFDVGCLQATLFHYGFQMPVFTQHCTCNLYCRRGLADLCEEFNIELNHHDALSDAMACAKLFKMYYQTH